MPECKPPAIDFVQSARRNGVNWLILLAGAGFLGAALSIEPGANCDAGGRCYPLFVWLGRALGGFLLVGAAVLLIRNPHRGIRFDPASGELVWWRDGPAAEEGADAGRVALSRIARVAIRSGSDEVAVRLIDTDGAEVPGFAEDVLPWRCEAWARRLVARWPHIALRVEE